VINVCIAGATGWAGRALVTAVLEAEDLALRSAVSRSVAGTDLGSALGGEALGIPVYATVVEALDGVDVLIDYTSHETVKANTITAIERGVAVVIGASGPTAHDYAEIDTAARAHGIGVISSGNFSITAAMAQAAAVLVARYLPQAEIVDYASDTKADVPSGTSRELAERLARERAPVITRSLDEIDGPREARGAAVDGVPVHTVRQPRI
jgi:4-hydroxy-tetrahydrodipicolinate reductase